MAVGWNEVNDLEVMRVGRLKLVGSTEVRGLSVATVGTGRVTVDSIVVSGLRVGTVGSGRVHFTRVFWLLIFKQPKK
jgi:hypothetical protein